VILSAVLRSFAIQAVADVRLIPNRAASPLRMMTFLSRAPAAAGIAYLPSSSSAGDGRREGSRNSGGATKVSFEAIADFMETEAFARGSEELMEAAAERADDDDVRRGGAVAVPSVVDRRCGAGARVECAWT
jgi:hypothetical protein